MGINTAVLANYSSEIFKQKECENTDNTMLHRHKKQIIDSQMKRTIAFRYLIR